MKLVKYKITFTPVYAIKLFRINEIVVITPVRRCNEKHKFNPGTKEMVTN